MHIAGLAAKAQTTRTAEAAREVARPRSTKKPAARRRAVDGGAARLAAVLRRSEDEGGAGAPAQRSRADAAEPRRRTQPGRRRPANAPAAAAVPAAAAPARGRLSREDAVKVSPRLPVETPSLKGSIALKRRPHRRLVLVKYHETVDPKSPNVDAVLADRQPAALLRRVRLGAAGRLATEGSRSRHAVAGRRAARPLTPGDAGDADLGQRPGPRLQAHASPSTTTTCSRSSTTVENTRAPPRSSLTPYARIHRYGTPHDRRATGSCTRA